MTTSAPQWPGQEGTRQQDEIRNGAARPASVPLQRTPAPTSSAQTPSQQPTPAQTTTAPLRAAGPGTAQPLQPVPDLPGASEGRTRQEQQQRRRAAARRNRFVVVRDPAGAGSASGAAAGQSQPAVPGGRDTGDRTGAARGGGRMPEREPAGAGRQPRALGGAGALHRPARWPASQWPLGHLHLLPGGPARPGGHGGGGAEGRPRPPGGAPPGRRRRPLDRDRASLVA